ncbi:MAG: hypothetical protein U0527_09015 [Candidatus Eisenbacteria bacterium]
MASPRPFSHRLLLVFVGLLLALSVRRAPADETSATTDSDGASAPPSVVTADQPLPELPEVLPFEPIVKEPVFAMLVGLVDTDSYGTLTREHIVRDLRRRKLSSKLPYQWVRSVTRESEDPGNTATVTVVFDHKMDLPVPYSLLGYHPGSFIASDSCVFREWRLGDITLQHPYQEKGKWLYRPLRIEDVHAYGLATGMISIDFDAWLDRLLGGALDDTDVVGLVLFKYNGVWTGMATGYSKGKSGRSGAFNFEKDEIMFPGPDEMKTIGRTLRGKMEEWLLTWPDWYIREGDNLR